MCVLRKKPTETRKKRWELSLEMLQIQEPPQMLSNNEIPFMFIWAIKPVVVPPELHFKQNINSQVITMRDSSMNHDYYIRKFFKLVREKPFVFLSELVEMSFTPDGTSGRSRSSSSVL